MVPLPARGQRALGRLDVGVTGAGPHLDREVVARQRAVVPHGLPLRLGLALAPRLRPPERPVERQRLRLVVAHVEQQVGQPTTPRRVLERRHQPPTRASATHRGVHPQPHHPAQPRTAVHGAEASDADEVAAVRRHEELAADRQHRPLRVDQVGRARGRHLPHR